ncbi:FAD-binding oxidoreductase [Alsobacter metallidurans]|uniref:FAD-binding oxidoreductase n=1 Tax=Alsobacter metallidurans TaxID=340221 RepID=A0A917MJB5_9HYPH|nr:FAD-binding oxidoreductase [Alsobacter metallidurans]GGH16540.1 FAD-binding oxidoreductase [Alsobacter metallidurans]
MPGRTVDVAIVGGGIAGCCAAFHLASRGVSVALFEKGAFGAGASGVNFGGVRSQGRHMAEMPLSRRARELWDRLPELVGTDGEFTPSGHLKLAYSPADMDFLERYAVEAREHGLVLELMGANAVRERHPWLGPEVVGASLCADDGHANPRLVAPSFAQAAGRLGAEMREQSAVTAIARDGDAFVVTAGEGAPVRSRWLVNAAGAWGAAVAAQFGEPVPLEPIAPTAMVTEPLPAFMDRAVGICGGGVALRQTRQGSVVIGGGESAVDMEAGRARPLAEICAAVLARAVRAAPRLANAQVLRAWAGVEGDMPDHLPCLGPSLTTPGLVHAFGFSQHGFQLGPAVGEAVADIVRTGAPSVDISRLSIGRFANA